MFKSTVCRYALRGSGVGSRSIASAASPARRSVAQPRPQLSMSSSNSRSSTRSSEILTSQPLISSRAFSSTPRLLLKDDEGSGGSGDDNSPQHPNPTFSRDEALPEYEDNEGRWARTDESVRVEYPEKGEMPRMPITQGRGGRHFRRTLASFSLEGKVSVVTGGARGLGLVMSQALVASGSDLAIVDLNEEEAQAQAKRLLAQFQDENPGLERKQLPKISAHYSDVADPNSVESCIEQVIAQHGHIDNLVTSAGFTENYDAVSYPYDRMQKLWGVNVDGPYLFAVALAKHLMARKAPGSVVMIGSMSGAIVNVPQPQAPYNAAKAAIRHLASSLAVEWARANIRVNCISPGYMLTELTKKILSDNPELHEKWVSLVPQGKMGVPEDLMGAVTFLLSDASKYVTGADLRVDGGYTLT